MEQYLNSEIVEVCLIVVSATVSGDDMINIYHLFVKLQIAIESIENIRTVKSLQLEDTFYQKYEKYVGKQDK